MLRKSREEENLPVSLFSFLKVLFAFQLTVNIDVMAEY